MSKRYPPCGPSSILLSRRDRGCWRDSSRLRLESRQATAFRHFARERARAHEMSLRIMDAILGSTIGRSRMSRGECVELAEMPGGANGTSGDDSSAFRCSVRSGNRGSRYAFLKKKYLQRVYQQRPNSRSAMQAGGRLLITRSGR
jgi:hypothetical protein